MKTILLLIFAVFLLKTGLSQSPGGFNYQAVLRDASGNIKANNDVIIRADIIQGAANGFVAYSESFTVKTNSLGLVNLQIGKGSVIIGSFSTISWPNGPFFIKIVVDGVEMGTSQLLSVPYALYANKAGNVFSGNYSDLANKPDFNKWDKDSTDNVIITGAQTISGNKTFTGTVSVNAPVSNFNAVNKGYVDSLIIRVMNSFAKSNETFTSPTTGTLNDIDGNTIKIVKIGSQWWTAENLKVIHYRDGSYILNVTNNATWGGLASGARCYYNNDSITYALAYGSFYNWYAVTDSRNLCPIGWHVPSDVEWTSLSTYLGGNAVAGGKLKESGTTHWTAPNTGATNESGFTAVAAGYRTGSFVGLGLYCDFWTSTAISSSNAFYIGLPYNSAGTGTNHFSKSLGIPVRCVRD